MGNPQPKDRAYWQGRPWSFLAEEAGVDARVEDNGRISFTRRDAFKLIQKTVRWERKFPPGGKGD